jgi:putative transposase
MLADLLSESYDADLEESWENKRTANALMGVAVRLHQTGCLLRETTTILADLGVERFHGSVWNWVHRLADSERDPPEAKLKQVAVGGTAVKINGEWSWLYAAIEIKAKLILDVALFGRHGTDPAATFLHRLCEKHDLLDAVFIVDQFGYRTALAQLGLNGRVNYIDRNLIEKWFHTLKMRVDRFHNSWVGSRASAREWIEKLVFTTTSKLHQSLGGKTPTEEVLN